MSSTERSSSDKPLPQFILRGLPQTSSSVTALTFMTIDSNDYLICGTDCGQLLLWSLKTYRCESVVNTDHNSRIQHLIGFDDKLLCQHKNGVIHVFDSGLTVQKSYSISDKTFCKCFLYSDNGFKYPLIKAKYLAFVSKTNNNFIEIIDFNCDKSLLTIGQKDGSFGWPSTLYMTPFDGKDTDNDIVLVLIGYENGFLMAFKADLNLNEYQLMTQLKCFQTIITAMDFNSDKMSGICGSVSDIISVWSLNVSEDKSIVSLSLRSDLKITNSGVLCCAIRSDGRIFVCGGSDHRIRVFAFKSLKALAVIDTHKQFIECLVFSQQMMSKPNQLLLAIGSRDKTISVWNLYNKSIKQ